MLSSNKISNIFLLALFVLLMGGCTQSDATALAELSPQQAENIVKSQNAVIIDVRTQEEWDAGHIPNAIHIPLSEVKDRLEEFKAYDGRTMVMQCHSGKRSSAAAHILLDAGFKNVSNLKGGIMAWKAEKLPIE